MNHDESRSPEKNRSDRYPPLRQPWWRALFWRVLPGACALLGCAVGVLGMFKSMEWYADAHPTSGGYYGEIGKALAMLALWCAGGGIAGGVIGWWIGTVLAARRPS